MTFSPMNPLIKALWVEALRSGKYKQGKLFLEKDGLHCCLGVLCRVTNQEPHQRLDSFGQPCTGFGDLQDFTNLPTQLIKELNLDPLAIDTLIHWNDKAGRDFHYIANWIETNL